MKRLAFVFGMVLLANIGLANSNNNTKFVPTDNTVMVEATADEFKTCKATVKGTIGGQEVDIEVTFEADNCAIGTAQLLKELAKE